MTYIANLHNPWIEAVKNGDESAASHLYHAYAKTMYNTLIRLTGNNEEVSDLLQDSFVKAFQKIHTFKGEGSFGSWLKQIVINTGLEAIRKKKIQYDSLNENESDIAILEEDLQEIKPEQIHQAIKRLPDGCRTVITLYIFEDFSHQQIANKLGISISTSKTQYMRARLLLKEMLTSTYYA